MCGAVDDRTTDDRGQRLILFAPHGDVGAPAVALYIADMTAQLESMATAAGLDLLAYFLAMARAESEAASREGAGAVSEDARSG